MGRKRAAIHRYATTAYDAEVADYVAAHGWILERDNESGGFFGQLPAFVLWASRPDMVLAASWFGIRSQDDAERMLLPEMRAADEEAPKRAACDHLWMTEAPDEGLEICAHDCGSRRFGRRPREQMEPSSGPAIRPRTGRPDPGSLSSETGGAGDDADQIDPARDRSEELNRDRHAAGQNPRSTPMSDLAERLLSRTRLAPDAAANVAARLQQHPDLCATVEHWLDGGEPDRSLAVDDHTLGDLMDRFGDVASACVVLMDLREQPAETRAFLDRGWDRVVTESAEPVKPVKSISSDQGRAHLDALAQDLQPESHLPSVGNPQTDGLALFRPRLRTEHPLSRRMGHGRRTGRPGA
jgi:hypothetical protein